MRLSPLESAEVVLARLRSSEPRKPTFVDPVNHQRLVDPTFEVRHAAWQAAIEREEARLKAEQEGKLQEHVDGLLREADQKLSARVQAVLEKSKRKRSRTAQAKGKKRA